MSACGAKSCVLRWHKLNSCRPFISSDSPCSSFSTTSLRASFQVSSMIRVAFWIPQCLQQVWSTASSDTWLIASSKNQVLPPMFNRCVLFLGNADISEVAVTCELHFDRTRRSRCIKAWGLEQTGPIASCFNKHFVVGLAGVTSSSVTKSETLPTVPSCYYKLVTRNGGNPDISDGAEKFHSCCGLTFLLRYLSSFPATPVSWSSQNHRQGPFSQGQILSNMRKGDTIP